MEVDSGLAGRAMAHGDCRTQLVKREVVYCCASGRCGSVVNWSLIGGCSGRHSSTVLYCSDETVGSGSA